MADTFDRLKTALADRYAILCATTTYDATRSRVPRADQRSPSSMDNVTTQRRIVLCGSQPKARLSEDASPGYCLEGRELYGWGRNYLDGEGAVRTDYTVRLQPDGQSPDREWCA